MKKIILIIFIEGISMSLKSQTILIMESANNLPIEFVFLMSEMPNAFAVTNSRGQADLSAFKGSNKIEIRSLGFKTIEKSFEELESMKFEISMTASNIGLGEVVVSATRWNQISVDIPTKITTITSKDAAMLNPQTAADLLGSSGEVFIQKSQQGGGSPMIRGFSTNRLLYAVDGIRMNTAIFRSGNIQQVISLDPLSIENTEVLFGPGSVIYGSDAIGGVMSFKTITPQMSLQEKPMVTGKSVLRYSTANQEKTGHFDLNAGWQKWASVTSFTVTEYDALKMGSNGPVDYLRPTYVKTTDKGDKLVFNADPLKQRPSGYSQYNIMQKFRFKPGQKWDLQYGFHYSETSEYARYDRLIEMDSNGMPRSAVWNYGPQKWRMNSLNSTYTRKAKMFDQFSLRFAHQFFEESRIDRNFSGGQRFRLRTNLEQVQAYSGNADMEKNLGKHKIFYGMEYVQNNVKSIGSANDIRNDNPIAVPDRYPQSTWKSYGGYVNLQFPVLKKISLLAGARFNRFEIESDFTRNLAFFPFHFQFAKIQNQAITGSLGMVYRPAENWKISIHTNTGFRSPNVDDIGKIFDFAGGEVVVPNPDLTAEYVYNGEVNISKVFGEILKLDLSGFYTYLDHAMVRREFQLNGEDSILYDGSMAKVYAIQNAAFAKVFGANLGFELQLWRGFSLSSRYNYQFGEEEMDNGNISRSRHAAPSFGITRLNYQHKKVQAQVYASYCDEVTFAGLNEEERQKSFIYTKDGSGNPYSPGWFTLNVKCSYQILKRLSISAGLENITDQRYRPYSSGIAAGGRNLILSLKGNI